MVMRNSKVKSNSTNTAISELTMCGVVDVVVGRQIFASLD